MTEADDQETRRNPNPVLTPVRLFLHLIIKAFVLVFLGIRLALRPKPVRFGLLALLVVGIIGWNVAAGSLQGSQISAGQQGVAGSTPAGNQLPPSPAVERYLQAQADFNARGMWDLISDDLKNSTEFSEASLPQLQAELDSARQQGRRYRGATYVGGVPMSQGRSVYFYVLTVDGPRGVTEVPYIYVVGPDGKIVSIQ